MTGILLLCNVVAIAATGSPATAENPPTDPGDLAGGRIGRVSATRPAHKYSVERDVRGPNEVEIALVRREPRPGLLHFGAGRWGEPVVIFSRTFRSMFELNKQEAYASELALAAEHAGRGTFGCFIDTVSRDGAVRITLYERWFDGERLHCDSLAEREFDAEDDESLVTSAEFVAALESWAEERNDERERSYLDASTEAAVRTERAVDRAAAADELARILAHARGDG